MTGLRRSRQRGARRHDIIDQQNIATGEFLQASGMNGDRLIQRGKPFLAGHALERSCRLRTHQKIRAMGMPRFLRHGMRQKRGLVEAAFHQAQPMQGHRGDQRIGSQKGGSSARQPFRGGPDNLVPVAMFERQNKGASIVSIEQRRTTLHPGSGDAHAIVTMHAIPLHLPWQRHAAGITANPGNEGRITPAWAAKREIALHLFPTKCAARGINQTYGCLKCPHFQPIVLVMTRILTDRNALTRNRLRAERAPALFLQERAADEIKDRLEMVNYSFTQPAIISGFPDVWQANFSDARCVPDDDLLDLEPGAHDLVIHALSLHWANDPVGQLIQARLALKPDGLFMGVLFGGTTLHELRSALAQAECDLTNGLSPRVAPMGEIRDLGALLQRAGFALPVADTLLFGVSYPSPLALMRDLRAMGEGNALAARARRFLRKSILLRAMEIYSDAFLGDDGRIPATFEFIFLTGWSPDASQPQPLRPGSAGARLADALRTKETRLED
mgnify:CR=1 FL=1